MLQNLSVNSRETRQKHKKIWWTYQNSNLFFIAVWLFLEEIIKVGD